MTTRRFTDLLPSIFQTDNNKRFAASTIDVLIQPGSADQVSGYIGAKPSYFDPSKDFYLPEPSAQRAAYQLPPVMISRDGAGEITHLFGYDDLINYLRERGAVITDENRLFTDKAYAWAPPVDLDKILNFQQYLWFGDAPSVQPTITLRPASVDAISDGVSATYPLPPVQGGVAASRELPLVIVDHTPQPCTSDGVNVTLLSVPPAGLPVKIFRYGDLRIAMEGLTAFDATAFLADAIPVSTLTSNMRVLLDDGVAHSQGFDFHGFEYAAQFRASGCPTYIQDRWDSYLLRDTDLFFVEGVGTSIALIPTADEPTLYTSSMYTTIDRRSLDRNGWSRSNYWVHRDAVAFSGTTFHDRRALRPIVEFLPNIELFNYGRRRLADINAVLSGSAYYVPDAFGGEDPVNVGSNLNASPIRLTNANGRPSGFIVVDEGHRLRPGDRFIVRNSTESINNCVIEVVAGYDATVNPLAASVCTFRIAHRPIIGDIVRLNPRGFIPWDAIKDALTYDTQPYDFSDGSIEYHFTAQGWVLSGNQDPLKDPLFALYTDDGTAQEALPGSTFAGNRLFGFTPGTGAVDPYVLRALAYDGTDASSLSAEISFTNDQFTVRATANGTPISGYQYYRAIGATPEQDTFGNGWFPTKDDSFQILSNGLFSQPDNLFKNPDMEEIDVTSRGRYFDHFTALMRRQPDFKGSPYQSNNWRDTTKDPSEAYTGPAWAPNTAYAVGATVVVGFYTYRCITAHTSGATFSPDNWEARPQAFVTQPRSSLLKTMLLAADTRFDYTDAVRFADSEYQRFRNKFYAKITEVLESGTCTESDSDDTWVRTILQALRVAKTPSFPFALSAMAGGGWFIPPTGAAMGILPVATPGTEPDDQISSAYIDVRGHDGSRTPYAPGLQARIMLALETAIYNAIPAAFRTDAKPYFDFDALIEARSTARIGQDQTNTTLPSPCDANQTPVQTTSRLYSPEEVIRILTPIFLRWAQLNNYDYRSNTTYDASNPFTWNYRGYADKDGRAQLGSYRAIYQWFFDTDRPHAAPWKMLGFFDQPSWWTDEYGPAPYTAGNTYLWSDLRDGRIRRGSRVGVDPRYARPDLLSILPVDDDGALRDPIATGVMPTRPSEPDAARDWEFGDQGPIETIWRNSASFPYARAMLGYLLRPAEWVEIGWDSLNYGVRPDGQWRYTSTGDRPRSALLPVHGEIDPSSGRPIAITGIQQWISDLMVSRTQKPALLGSAVRGLGVRLAHKMAAFTQTKSLRIFADNFGILPAEDTQIVLHRSPPVREAVYSGVIIEWNGSGWSVIGYDTEKSGFCIVPGRSTSQTRKISLGDDPQVYEWAPRREYPMNVLIEYSGSIYRCIQAHTSGLIFDKTYWSPSTIAISRFPKVTVTTDGEDYQTFVPYGTVFTSVQGVANFLWDYGRALEQEGFVFDTVDPVTGAVQDWDLAIRQFMEWTQADWQPGNIIALSPGASGLKFVSAQGYVMNLTETVNGVNSLIDRTGRPLARRSTVVSRIDDTTQIVCQTSNLFAARLRVGEVEHAIVFSNITIFGDVIYRPLYALGQPRLRLIGLRSRSWAGRLDAPGYVVNDNDMFADFDRAAENLRTMFEIEASEDADLRDHARHVIGYQTRPYLQNLLISDTQQFEFYQGMIQQKGAPGVFEKLTRSKIIDDDVDLAFLDEWGFQIGTFGATEARSRLSFRLDQSDLRGAPQFVFFGPDDPYDAIVALPQGDARWIDTPIDPSHAFPMASAPVPYAGGGSPLVNPAQPALPTAGPVRVDEVDATCFSPAYFQQLYYQSKAASTQIGDGWTLWVYNMGTNARGWDVLRAYTIGGAGCTLVRISTNTEDPTIDIGTMRLTFSSPHGLQARDVGLPFIVSTLTGSNPEIEGFQTIGSIESPTTILIGVSAAAGIDLSQTGSIYCYVLRSQRFTTMADRNAFYAIYPMVDGQYCYVDFPAGVA